MAKGWKKSQPHIVQPKAIQKPKESFRAFTLKFERLSNRIVTPVGITPAFDPKDHPDKMPHAMIQKMALWDTGATRSVLTRATVKELNLTQVGTATVNHAGGTSESGTYLVNFYLPNHVGIAGVLVSECDDIAGNFGAIVGMDIIAKGDFSVTNVGNKTWVSYRYPPSTKGIDYVEEFTKKAGH